MNADERFAKVLINLKNIRPFYSAVYEALERVENDSVPTMGVSTTKMIYNAKFVESLQFSELVFVSLHEIAHVSLMHVSRRGDRDPELWNVAADLYVNKLLSEEFNITPGHTSHNGMIKFLKGGLYWDDLDLDSDTTEELYEELESQAKNNGYFENQELNTEKDFEFQLGRGGSGSHGNHKPFKLTIRRSTIISDIFDNDGKDAAEKENDNKRVLIEARTKCELHGGIGTGRGLLEFKVNEILSSHIDWRKLLRKYAIQAASKDSSFSNPDKRMYYQKAIYPGQMLDGTKTIKNIKICFDASGSISDEDLGHFYGQVKQLLNTYKVDAELIYWDTEVESNGSFKTFSELSSISAVGRGGTDASCVFKYFDSKRCKVKPLVSVIFTDGFIPDIENKKWEHKYKDTIWVMTRDYNKNLKPPFGKLTIAKFSN